MRDVPLAGEEVDQPAEASAREDERDGASSLTKMLSILDIFSIEHPVRSTAEILEATRSTRSTGYRYIKALTSAGLLSAVGNGHYILGSRIIELDLQIRETDPLLQSAEGVLEDLVEKTGHSSILCMLFQNSVLCIDEHRTAEGPKVLFSRGQRRTLFKGAMSKVILAHLPTHRLRSIFARRGEDIRNADLGKDWDQFRDTLATIRSNGFFRSQGEFHGGIIGIGAPLFNADDAIVGSLGVAWGQDEKPTMPENEIIDEVRGAAAKVSARMKSSDLRLAMPPRAVG